MEEACLMGFSGGPERGKLETALLPTQIRSYQVNHRRSI
jgi:hypothetical protein